MATREPAAQTPPNLKSTLALFNAVRESLTSRGFPEETALPTTYFVFSTWFTDCLPRSPCLLITGPRPEGRFLLELLECLVHQPLPLGHLTGGGLLSLPMDPQPTLLIDHERMGSSTRELIRASNRRNAYVTSKEGLVNIFCAKALYCGIESSEDYSDESALHVNVPPSRGPLPVLDDVERHAIASDLQPRLLAYRHRNLDEVRVSNFDLPEFTSAIRILSRILGAPIVDAPELQADLRPLLQQLQEDVQAKSWSDVRSVAIEALLYHCHQEQAKKLHIGDVARTATAILKGRGETTEVGPKEVGAILRSFGLPAKRDRHGFAIRLDSATRRCIHELARRFAVATVHQDSNGCSSCHEIVQGADAGIHGATPSAEVE